jgi:hypothetical protein
VPLDRSTRLFTTTSGVVTQDVVAEDGTLLARITTMFTPALSLRAQSVIIGAVDETLGDAQDTNPILWGDPNPLGWGGYVFVWGSP